MLATGLNTAPIYVIEENEENKSKKILEKLSKYNQTTMQKTHNSTKTRQISKTISKKFQKIIKIGTMVKIGKKW